MDKKIVLLLDIDETIFDTNIYKKELSAKLSVELGYSTPDEFAPIFKELLDATVLAKFYFDSVYFLEAAYIVRKRETTLERLDEIFWDKTLFNNLYPDVTEFLETISGLENVTLGILSTGDTKHQREKIASILHFFDDANIHIFPDKIAVMDEVLKKYQGSKIIFADDREEALERAKITDPTVKIVLICRGNKVNSNNNFDGIFTNLHDILSLIN